MEAKSKPKRDNNGIQKTSWPRSTRFRFSDGFLRAFVALWEFWESARSRFWIIFCVFHEMFEMFIGCLLGAPFSWFWHGFGLHFGWLFRRGLKAKPWQRPYRGVFFRALRSPKTGPVFETVFSLTCSPKGFQKEAKMEVKSEKKQVQKQDSFWERTQVDWTVDLAHTGRLSSRPGTKTFTSVWEGRFF